MKGRIPLLTASLTAMLSFGYAGVMAAAPSGIQVTTLDTDTENSEFRNPVAEEPEEAMEGVYQQQLLQNEVQDLRGMVEELTQQVKEMSQRQADRYQDVDRRLEDLRVMVNELAVTGTSGRRAPEGQTFTATTPTKPGAKDEKTLYDTALEMIRNRKYESAIAELQQVVENYPTGEYAPNAYYWLGEVYAALPKPDYEKARQALAQVISYFPDNRKVPDAAFKLGKVYHLMGDCPRAKELLKQVVVKYPNTAVAKLAESYLKDKVKCDS